MLTGDSERGSESDSVRACFQRKANGSLAVQDKCWPDRRDRMDKKGQGSAGIEEDSLGKFYTIALMQSLF